VTTAGSLPLAPVHLAEIARRIWRRVLVIVACSVAVTVTVMLAAYGFVDVYGPLMGFLIPLVAASFALGKVANYQILLERQSAELAVANGALEERNEDLTRFARTVAHDLKGPLSGIVGWSAYAVDIIDSDRQPDLAAALDDVRQSSLDAVDVVDGLLALALAHADRLDAVEVDPLAALQRAVERVKRLAPEGAITIEPSTDFPHVLGHPVALEAVWSNLLSNALKYGGQPPRVRVTIDMGSGAARFEVTDNGDGVADGVEPFGEFAASTEARWSHGLGLPITRHFVERFGGRIGHRPAADGGTTFWFELPTAAQPVTS
jgi:two-component system, sensor histidine kinase and response regulator